MTRFAIRLLSVAAAAALTSGTAQAAEPTDPQIAHIAYTAGAIDVDAAKQALKQSKSKSVREFAAIMLRDHEAVNKQALALVGKLKVTPEDNATSKALSAAAMETKARLVKLKGPAFDRAYVANEVAFHKTVNGALSGLLIPAADNGELKSLLTTGLKLFEEHQQHAEHLASSLK